MKKALILLACLCLGTANAQVITYSESFTNLVAYSGGTSQYDNWIAFRASLDTAIYDFTSVTIKGSNDATGITCSDPTNAKLLATALKNSSTATSVSCGGVIWRVGDCGSGIELNANNTGSDCTCANPGYTMRVDIGTNNWGGVNSTTCSGPTQTITVEFTYDTPCLWAAGIGSTSNDEGLAITTDIYGNVYTTGSYIGTVDFDPGIDTFNLTAVSADLFVTKMDHAGNLLWAKSMGGSSGSVGNAIAVDDDGNVHTTGTFRGTVDFDPGAGTYNLTYNAQDDIFVSKLDSDGDFVWAVQMSGSLWELSYGIAVDASGNVFTAGQFGGTVDFDPGAGTANLVVTGFYDIFVSKLNSSGAYVGAVQLGGTDGNYAYALALDGSGNVFITGRFDGTCDFDPSGSTYNLTAFGGHDLYVSKLSNSLGFVWAKQMGGTGYSGYGYGITVDPGENVLSTGYFAGTMDFDPSGSVSNLTAVDQNDIYIHKLSNSGTFTWAKSIGGSSQDFGFGITTDASSNVYTTGLYYGTVDFDPGSGTSLLSSLGGSDIFVSKLNSSGTFISAKTLGGTSVEQGNGIAVDGNESVYITGEHSGTADFEPGADSINITTAGSADIFVCKIPAVDFDVDYSPASLACFADTAGSGWITSINDGNPSYSYLWSNGGTNDTIIDLGAGTYYVTVTDAASCYTAEVITIIEPSQITFTATQSSVSCNGGNDGSILFASMGGSGFRYHSVDAGVTWTTDLNILNLAAGDYYTMTKDDSNCVTVVDTVTVIEPTLLSTTFTQVDVDCYGGANGSATAVPAGGTPPYNYNWSTGGASATISSLFPGSYSVNVFDLNSCVTNNTVIITEPGEMTASLIGVDATCTGGSDGSVNLTYSGGTSPYTFAWSNAASTEDISGLVAGTYFVTLTDSCGAAIIDSVEVDDPAALGSSIVATSISCKGSADGSADLTVTGGTLPYTYLWDDPGTSVTEDISGLDSGVFTVNISDACAIGAIDNITINEPDLLTNSIGATDVSCNGGGDGTATVTVSGGTSPFLYNWNSGQTTSTAIALFPGTYGVNVFDANGCLTSNSVSVTQPSAVSATLSVTYVSCNAGSDGAINLTTSGGTGPFTYSWSNSATTEDVAALTADTYSVTVTDACGAVLSDSAAITQPGALASTISQVNVSCNAGLNGEADLTVSGGVLPYTYAWSNSASTEDISGLVQGTYYVTITDNCTQNTLDTVIISEPIVLTTTTTKTDVNCNGATDGTATVTPAGGTSPYVYFWSNNQTTSTAIGLFPGNYTVNVVDANGCLATDIIAITQPDALTGAIVSITDVLCNGNATGGAVVNASNGTSPYTYLWNDGSSQTDSNAVGLTAGNYSVTISDFCGASVSQTGSVTEPAAMSIATSKTDVSCFGYGDGIAGVTVSDGTGPFTYSWSPSGDTTASISGLNSGTHVIMVTSSCGNVASDSTVIVEPTVLTTSMVSTNVSCNTGGNGTAMVTAGGGVSPYNYLWSNGQSNSMAIGLFPGGYSVNITDVNGCLTSDVVSITEPSAMTGTLSSTPVSCMVGNNGTATVAPSGGTLPYSYLWSPSGDITATAINLVEDIYTVTLMDSCGATIVDSIVVGGPSSTSISLSANQISCNGFNDGSIDLSVTNGTPPINYLWSTGDTTEDLTGLSPGTYTVTVTDSCGTALSDSLIITEPLSLTTSIASVNATCNGLGDGTASVSVAGGTSPYNYTWNNGQFTSTSFALFPGNYSVNVIDFNGCLVTDLVTITEPSALSIGVSITDATCGESDGSVDAVVTGGVSPYMYAWSSGGSGSTDSLLVGGTYSLIVTDTNGCSDSINVVIPITAPVQEICIITVDSTSTKNVVVWEKPIATNIDSFRIYRDIVGVYTWVGSQQYGIDSYFTDSTNGVNPKITSYRYKVTTLDACGNESVMGNYHETIHVQTTDNGSTVDLLWDNYEGFNFGFYRILRDSTGLGGANWEALDSVTNSNFTFSDINPPTSGAEYVIEVVPSSVCTADKAKNYNSSKSNTSSVGGQGNMSATTASSDASFGGCDGTATVAISGGVQPYTYLWDGSAGFQGTATAVGLCAGNYDVTVTDASGESLVASQIVAESGGTALNAATSTTNANSGQCDGTATVTATGGTQPYTYIWDGNASNQTTQTATALCAGTYSVIVMDSSGNQTTVFATVGTLGGTTLTATTSSSDTDDGQCDGIATVTASGGTPPYAYQWDGNAGDQTAETATGLCVGTYSVVVTDSTGNQTTVFASVNTIIGIIGLEDIDIQLSVNPNPFNHSTEIKYTLVKDVDVILEVYNLMGERIALLAQEDQIPGEYSYSFGKENRNLSAGVYTVSLRIDGVQMTRRIVALQ